MFVECLWSFIKVSLIEKKIEYFEEAERDILIV